MHRKLRLRSLLAGGLLLITSTLLPFTTFSQDQPDATSTDNAEVQDAPAEANGGADAELVKIGLGVYQNNCTQCHAFNKVVVGPALKNAHTNWPSKDALLSFIKYPQKTIDGGNEHAKALYEQYKQYMPNHDFLTDQELNGLYAFIVSESTNPTLEIAAEAATEAVAAAGGSGGGVSQEFLVVVLAILIIILVAIIVALVMLLSLLQRFVAARAEEYTEEDKQYIKPGFDFGAFLRSKPVVNTLALIFVLVVLKAGIDGLYSIGIQQGYAPTQPIAFSHKLHAGMYQIECQYCHTGVTKSKNANIPSANICMNCHNTVKVASPEIQKIYKAIETNRPIEWVRVHNLPDLAYFNHSQHVNVAGLECQTCHGEVQEMEIVQQYSPLTMGWCINCHRETIVKADGNAYYDQLLEFHAGQKAGMTVEQIGGLECSKCHY